MIIRPLTLLSQRVNTNNWIIARVATAGYVNVKDKGKGCLELSRSPAAAAGGGGGGVSSTALKRPERSAKCRLIWFPEEWFTFFHVKTGVSGFYVLLIGLANYCLSKEIFVMEHEYYTGLSWIVMLWVAVTKMGPGLAKSLDKQVDEIVEGYYTGRKQEIAMNETIIKNAQIAQLQAQGQKMLIDAKKENVLMQLEAIYRERAMMVYRTVKGRMDYHAKLQQAEGRIHQKWMISWILDNVMKSITPEFEAQALSTAIREIEEVASRA